MSRSLQIVVRRGLRTDPPLAEREGLTMAEWARRALRDALRRSDGDVARRLAAIRAASELNFPTADIEQMQAEIEQGYRGD